MNGPLGLGASFLAVLHRTQPNTVISIAFLQIFTQFHVLALRHPFPMVYRRIVDQLHF